MADEKTPQQIEAEQKARQDAIEKVLTLVPADWRRQSAILPDGVSRGLFESEAHVKKALVAAQADSLLVMTVHPEEGPCYVTRAYLEREKADRWTPLPDDQVAPR